MRNAAGQIWPHLAQGTPDEVEQRHKPPTAQSMYPSQPSLVPKPERQLSYEELKAAWHEHLWALVGIRRKR